MGILHQFKIDNIINAANTTSLFAEHFHKVMLFQIPKSKKFLCFALAKLGGTLA